MAQKPCLVCGTPSDGSRCPEHTTRKQRTGPSPYNRRHKRLKDQAVNTWVLQHGWVCPGYLIDAHAVRPGGLEGEHIIPVSIRPDLQNEPANYTVLCRVCNARKGNKI